MTFRLVTALAAGLFLAAPGTLAAQAGGYQAGNYKERPLGATAASADADSARPSADPLAEAG
ncbi:MAG TPA: hypothetical protein VNK43_13260, partial [Gemmatimonadales bacterium]|nr:hypothetical protein [Gemmatimonadales bacterium]